MELGVEVCDREAVDEVERPGATVAGANAQCVVDEVEVDLKCLLVVVQPPGREAAQVDVQRGVPPVVARRRRCEPDLADDLAEEMQCVLGRAPVG